ncbi:AraC family transcriptional regulator [Sinorhizobium fredii]|uniref:AraC family transcriptional regulator n=1 Tax=Rhizobium fredii TaxID=380 RepID=UPI0004B48450|nr:AraC family transcriptional regulator [Sinorhizobium fredii]
MHAPILAAYLGSDPVAASSLSEIANPLRRVDIVDHRFLRPGRSAQILIVDCREPKPDDYRRGNLSPELMQLALVSENSLYRKAIFASGYSDYLLWPLIEQEVVSRLAACIAQIERGSAGVFFSGDPLVQKSCDLLAQRVGRQTALSELARMVGTNRTTLVNRFEASFGCGPMTWLRHYRMAEAARRLRSGHESVVIHLYLTCLNVADGRGSNFSITATLLSASLNLSDKQTASRLAELFGRYGPPSDPPYYLRIPS